MSFPSIQNVLEARNGAVLNKSTILKSDHFDSSFNPSLKTHLQGAPNWREAGLNIFGVAVSILFNKLQQPSVSGISTLLTALKSGSEAPCVWFSAREEPIVYINKYPYVLRDADSPLSNIKRYAGINATRLEAMEDRLKNGNLCYLTTF
jgi:hypothetical protein